MNHVEKIELAHWFEIRLKQISKQLGGDGSRIEGIADDIVANPEYDLELTQKEAKKKLVMLFGDLNA